MTLSRRGFVRLLGAGLALGPTALSACLEPREGAALGAPGLDTGDASTAMDAADAWQGAPPDTWDAYQEIGVEVTPEVAPEGWPIVIAETFTVHLADRSCSGHDHSCTVEAGKYWDDEPVEVFGGHPMALRPSEMQALEGGGQIPFHTLPHGAHHHCGTAIRSDAWDGEQDSLEDYFACVVPDTVPEDGATWGACIMQ